jgi:outer membrane protein assembly factor BamD
LSEVLHMMTRLPLLVVLAFAGWSHVASAEQAGADVEQQAGKEMDVGRWYIGRRDYTAAINRFKTVVIHYQASQHVEEALAHLVEAYLALGIPCEAQNTAAVLSNKFPDGRWTSTAREGLKAAGVESERRCY